MDASSFSGTVNLHDSRATSHRPFCLGTEQSTAGILRSRTGPKGLGIRRIFHQLGKHARICIPPNIPAPPGNNENCTGAVQGDPDSPLLVHPPLILPRRQDLLLQPRSQIPHPGVESLHLTSWMLSSNPLDQLAFQQTLQALQPSAAEPQRGEPMTADYNISINGAGTSLLIPARHR